MVGRDGEAIPLSPDEVTLGVPRRYLFPPDTPNEVRGVCVSKCVNIDSQHSGV